MKEPRRRLREVQPAGPWWATTTPYNYHHDLGHVDWVSAAGYPCRATLHADGRWSSTVAQIAEILDAYWTPEESADSPYGLDVLEGFRREVNGRLHLRHVDLILSRTACHDPDEGQVDG